MMFFKKSVFDPQTNKYKEAELGAENIIELSKKLGVFGHHILESIKQDPSNIFLETKKIVDKILQSPNKADSAEDELWQALKRNFNNALSKCSSQIKVEITEPLLEDFYKAENKFCEGMLMKDPIEHFVKITKHRSSKGKSDKTFLTNQEYILFIKKAFLKQEDIGKIRMKMNRHTDTGFIIKGFHQFFKEALDNYPGEVQLKERCVKLLTDNFIDWDYDKVFKNFRSHKTNRIW